MPAARSGYIQEIDGSGIVDLASRHQTTVWLLRRPGDFVVDGGTIAAVHPPRDGHQFAAALERAYTIGTERTSRQDAAFAVQQLVEVALRALSPAVNEAFTALTCIDRLGQGFDDAGAAEDPEPGAHR